MPVYYHIYDEEKPQILTLEMFGNFAGKVTKKISQLSK